MAADRVLATLFVAALAFATPTGLSQRRAVTEWPVGAITRTFVPQGTYNWRGAATHALVTSLWYPAVRGTSVFEHDIGPPGSPLFHLGEWADDARAAKGPFPLIALSHGTGGSAQIMAWLARALASRGYVVAAVNHPPWSPHILRHTFCSHLAMRGAPVRAIQELAGHQDLSTTSRYMHLSATATESAIRLLEPSVSIARGDAVERGNLGIEKANR